MAGDSRRDFCRISRVTEPPELIKVDVTRQCGTMGFLADKADNRTVVELQAVAVTRQADATRAERLFMYISATRACSMV